MVVNLVHDGIEGITLDRPNATNPRRNHVLPCGIEITQFFWLTSIQGGMNIVLEINVIFLDHRIE